MELRLRPAPPDTGRIFVRSDLPGRPHLRAGIERVSGNNRCTTLALDAEGGDDLRIRTVEHLLAALGGLGIDNLEIAVRGGEIPVMDGSASPFVEAILEVGLAIQDRTRRVHRITEPIWARSGDGYIVALPHDGLRITYTLDYNHRMVGTQLAEVDIDPATFAREVAPARTFGFLHEVEALRRAGLARGGSRENAVIIGRRRILSTLRFSDEFARHKILDIVGDLSLTGHVRAHIIGIRSGHALNTELARQFPTGRIPEVRRDPGRD